MYVAHTRRSALQAGLDPFLPHFALPLMEAVVHGTRDAAWACRAEHRIGTLRAGMSADFVVLDVDPFERDPEALLHAEVVRTVIGGR